MLKIDHTLGKVDLAMKGGFILLACVMLLTGAHTQRDIT